MFHVPGDSTQLDLDGLLYIGGVGAPFAPLTVPPVLWTGALRQGYVGCMRDLVINGQPIDIAGYAQQQDSGKKILWLYKRIGTSNIHFFKSNWAFQSPSSWSL